MSAVLKVENISKMYRLGEVSTGALVHDVNRWWHKIRGKEDPYISVAQANARDTKGSSDYVWALKDISFEVQQGDVLGIIGRNGAGKSTLLKILSRITAPTTGKIKVKGRIASLLEVGTGFHPELTGRENIYLNGAILGMTKAEINRKFDEIVDFSGVERYIDTPVKRYSSGMYVRLAFAVAAHLESEILIIDEVLAVGDAEFQKKCLGKMKDVSSNEGRTVLFVSHNMAAIVNLCNIAVLMQNGQLTRTGRTLEVIDYYHKNIAKSNLCLSGANERFGSQEVRFDDLKFLQDGIVTDCLKSLSPLRIILKLNKRVYLRDVKIDIGVNSQMDNRVAWISTQTVEADKTESLIEVVIFDILNFNLVPGTYSLNLYMTYKDNLSDWITGVCMFEVIDFDYYKNGKKIPRSQGYLLLKYDIFAS